MKITCLGSKNSPLFEGRTKDSPVIVSKNSVNQINACTCTNGDSAALLPETGSLKIDEKKRNKRKPNPTGSLTLGQQKRDPKSVWGGIKLAAQNRRIRFSVRPKREIREGKKEADSKLAVQSFAECRLFLCFSSGGAFGNLRTYTDSVHLAKAVFDPRPFGEEDGP